MGLRPETTNWASDNPVPVIDRIVMDICELENNPLPGMTPDDVWLSLDDLRTILERHLANG